MNSGQTIQAILVLCEGNHCRSPLAEGLLKAALGPSVQVESAGLSAQDGYAPHPFAISLMAERGINITTHRSRQVTHDMALAADLILVMDHRQKTWCSELIPGSIGRVSLLGQWLPEGEQDIADPISQPQEIFPIAFDKILRSVDMWRNHLNSIRGSE